MPRPFLTDDIMWRLVCAARLAELDPRGSDPKHHADVASRLQTDPHLGCRPAIEAAESYMATAMQRAA